MAQRTLGILSEEEQIQRGATLVGLRFKILGRTALRFGDHQPFDDRWGSTRLRGMLGALLLHANHAVSIAELIEWVWPDGRGPDKPADTFYSYASRIRNALRRMNSVPGLVGADGMYRLDVEQNDVDFFTFNAEVEKARKAGNQNDHEQASRVLIAALDLWTDRPLVDLQGDRAANWRHWADTELWLPAQDLLLQELSALGRFDQVLHRVAELPAARQASLSLVKRKLEALYGLSRYREATSYLLRMRKHFQNSGDLDEADDLLRFNDSLAHEPALDVAPEPGPPVTVAVAVPRLLRRDVQDFTGRDDLLRRLDEVTTTPTGAPMPGVVVLEGAAGVGKTALAVHWAHRSASRYPQGVLYVDLGGFSHGPRVEAGEAVDEFLAILGFSPERIMTAGGRQAKLRDLLNRCALVVLDNAFDSEHVEPLLDCLSACQVIVTSRRRLSGLGRRGARNLTVAPLSYQLSRSWLVRSLGERLTRSPEATAMLAAMCGGNMLALRVVAQHVAAAPQVPIDELADELRDSRTLLGLGDDGDGPDSSVRAALAMSYRALGTEDRRTFRLLGLHLGPDLSVDVATVLVGQDRKQTERSLGRLANGYLLSRESRERYRFHDLVRKFAAELIDAPDHVDERAAGAERLLSYFLSATRSADNVVFPFRPGVDPLPLAPGVVPLEFASDETAMDWFAHERANINAVIEFAHVNNFDNYVPKLVNATGEIFQRLGFSRDVTANLLFSVAAARRRGDIEEEGNASNNIVYMALNRHDLDTAETYLAIAEERYTAINYEIGLAVATHHRGRLCLERGEFERCVDLYQKSLAMLRRNDVRGLEVIALYRLGQAYRRRQAFDEAASFCRDGLWLAERLDNENGQALCLTELAAIYYERGDVASARGYATRALDLHRRQRDRAEVGKVSNLLAKLDLEQADLTGAERHARMALELCCSTRDTEGEATARDTLARVYHSQARHEEAAREWSVALGLFTDLGDPRAAAVRTRLAELPDAPPVVPQTRTEPLVKPRHSYRTDLGQP
jgi:tetratricopeptide (TPR) repeat protein/DNA-binding SARP family transcriptional activator